MVDILRNPDFSELQPLKGKNVVITGTTRGQGKASALAFAAAGADILGSRTSDEPRSVSRHNQIVEEARRLNPNVNFDSVTVDITIPEHRRRLLEAAVGGDLENPSKKIDVLVLNAAGGLEEDKGPDWADVINHDAQLALVQEFLPYMSEGGKIIFMQSLWAHNFGKIKQLASYESVARTKNAAVRDLMAMTPKFEERGLKFGVLVADVIKDTGVYSLFKRLLRDKFTAMAAEVPGGEFPTAKGVADELVDMTVGNWESGHTRFVGRRELEPFDESIFGEVIDVRSRREELLPMYSDDSLYVDRFVTIDQNTGVGEYTVRPKDVAGHFTGPYERMKVEPAKEIMEVAAQTAGMLIGQTRMLGDGMPLFIEFEGKVRSMGFPGEKLKIIAHVEKGVSNGMVCTAEVFGTNDTPVANFSLLFFQIFPSVEVGWRVYRRELEKRGLKMDDVNVQGADSSQTVGQ